nr:hypothetical protein [Tanacetum cinerariifolium]
MILESVENGQLIWPMFEENSVTRPRKYFELTPAEEIQTRKLTSFFKDLHTRASGSNSGQQRTVICYNCKGEGHMSKQCIKPKMKQDDSWFKDKVLLVQAQANGQILYEEELAFLADLGITEVALMTNLSRYGLYALAEVHNLDNMDNNMINQGIQARPSSEQSSVMNHSETEITSDSNIILYSQYVHEIQHAVDPIPSFTPTRVEVPKELPKVSMVYTSLKKHKHHLAGFDMVVKERTTATSITKGSWGFEHIKACFRDEMIPFVKVLKDIFNTFDQYLIDELNEVQNVFHQIEQAVEQHHLESKMFKFKMNQVLNENERLLEQVITKDIVNIFVNSSVDNASVNMNECKKCLELETELLNKKDFIKKETYDKLFRSYTTLEKHYISLEVDTQFNQEIFQRENSVSNQSAPSFD